MPELPRQLGGTDAAFASGDSRLCFVDPLDPAWCIKIQRPDRSPHQKRSEQAWLKRRKALHRFDDNLQELRVYRWLARRIGAAASALVPRMDGLVATDLGPGLRCELIRDDDGRISLPLLQYLWLHGRDEPLAAALERFRAAWQQLGMPSRRLLLHNIVVQCRQDRPSRLVVIDSLGWPELLPLGYWLRCWARRRARQKLQQLEADIATLLQQRQAGSQRPARGWLTEARRQAVGTEGPRPGGPC